VRARDAPAPFLSKPQCSSRSEPLHTISATINAPDLQIQINSNSTLTCSPQRQPYTSALRCNPQTGTSAPCCRTMRPWMRISQDNNIFATTNQPCVRWVHRTLHGRSFRLRQGLDLPPRAACFSVRLCQWPIAAQWGGWSSSTGSAPSR
jgi:hypothetical protein